MSKKSGQLDRPTPETDDAQHEGLLRGNPMPTQVVHVNFARKLERERDEAREAIREAWLAIDEVNDGTDRMINWQNKYAYILEETK